MITYLSAFSLSYAPTPNNITEPEAEPVHGYSDARSSAQQIIPSYAETFDREQMTERFEIKAILKPDADPSSVREWEVILKVENLYRYSEVKRQVKIRSRLNTAFFPQIQAPFKDNRSVSLSHGFDSQRAEDFIQIITSLQVGHGLIQGYSDFGGFARTPVREYDFRDPRLLSGLEMGKALLELQKNHNPDWGLRLRDVKQMVPKFTIGRSSLTGSADGHRSGAWYINFEIQYLLNQNERTRYKEITVIGRLNPIFFPRIEAPFSFRGEVKFEFDSMHKGEFVELIASLQTGGGLIEGYSDQEGYRVHQLDFRNPPTFSGAELGLALVDILEDKYHDWNPRTSPGGF